MKDLFDLIKDYAAKLGITEQYIDILAYTTLIVIGVGIILPVFSAIWKAITSILLWNKQRVLNQDLHPFYTPIDVEKATRYYVPTQYQSVSPSEDDEPGKKYAATPKAKLIPFFLKEAFKFGKDYHKYYLILADTGMGKTTFMINLYIAYKNQWTIFGAHKYDIKLLPLGSPDTFAAIQRLENKENTILLLDAFDEDVQALHNYHQRMAELLTLVKDFREIVITCRTQFFPTQKEEPYETGYVTFGDESAPQKFQKLYVSVFQDKDIKRYLHKRFPLYQWKKRKRAWQIAQKSPNLVMRPMLLSHIQDLLDSPKEYHFSFEIYEKMIEKWVQREAKKPGILQKYGSINAYEQKLKAFSQRLAVDMYLHKKERKGYFVGKEEEYGKAIAKMIEGDSTPAMDEMERRSRSMLNRNAEGKYKFAHKSIMEYFLLIEMLNKPKFYYSFDFEGMEAATLFINEIAIIELQDMKGTFTLNKPNDKAKSLSTLKKEYFPAIKAIYIDSFERNNIFLLNRLPNIKQVVIVDKQKYKILYLIYSSYLSYYWQKLIEFPELLERHGWIERHELHERIEWQELLGLIGKRVLQEEHELISDIRNKDKKTLQELQDIEVFLKDMKAFKQSLPKDCELIY